MGRQGVQVTLMSTPCRVDISASIWPTSNILAEIKWCEAKIASLQPALARRPRVQRQINDWLRQIEDKKRVLQFRGLSV